MSNRCIVYSTESGNFVQCPELGEAHVYVCAAHVQCLRRSQDQLRMLPEIDRFPSIRFKVTSPASPTKKIKGSEA